MVMHRCDGCDDVLQTEDGLRSCLCEHMCSMWDACEWVSLNQGVYTRERKLNATVSPIRRSEYRVSFKLCIGIGLGIDRGYDPELTRTSISAYGRGNIARGS